MTCFQRYGRGSVSRSNAAIQRSCELFHGFPVPRTLLRVSDPRSELSRWITSMGLDKHTLQKWVAGAELRVTKTHKPFAGLPLVSRNNKLAEHSRELHLTRKK